MNKDELFHSEIYLGQDFSDGFKHFKYIKREKKNGKWVYYYKDDALKSLQKKAASDSKALQAENKKRGYGNDNNMYFMKDGKTVGKDKKYQKLANDATYSNYKYELEKNKSEKRKQKLDKIIKTANTLSTASYETKKAVEKGKKKLDKFLKSTAKNIKNAAKETANEIKDSTNYAKAAVKGKKTYTDSKGNTRITEATRLGKSKFKSFQDVEFTKYRKLKAEEDRINENKKKKKKKS